MKYAPLWIGFLLSLSSVYAKLDFLSDYHQTARWREELGDENDGNFEQFARYLRSKAEEAEAAAAAKEEEEREEDPETVNELPAEETNPLFAYQLPKSLDSNEPSFAVGPSDPRFYGDFPNAVRPTESEEIPSGNKDKGSRPNPTPRVNDQPSVSSDENKPYFSAIKQTPVSEALDDEDKSDIYFTAVVAGCCAAAVVGVVAVGISCYRLQKNAKAAADVEYPAYGVTGPNKDISPTSGDRRLAQSAQMYHYQHQKQEIIAMESRATNDRHGSISDAESDEENEEGDYTVYECPGLASTGEMEVKNPLFHDDPTPASPAKQAIESSSEQTQELPK